MTQNPLLDYSGMPEFSAIKPEHVKEALKKFADTMGDNNYEERKKFFKKFKK